VQPCTVTTLDMVDLGPAQEGTDVLCNVVLQPAKVLLTYSPDNLHSHSPQHRPHHRQAYCILQRRLAQPGLEGWPGTSFSSSMLQSNPGFSLFKLVQSVWLDLNTDMAVSKLDSKYNFKLGSKYNTKEDSDVSDPGWSPRVNLHRTSMQRLNRSGHTAST
jgi:hypothetical protein